MPTCRLINNSVFVHVPKTAGTTVTYILDHMGLVKHRHRPPHPRLRELEPSPFRFAFVRHPWDWLKSQYRYMVLNEWTKGFWREFSDPTFEGFVRKVYAAEIPRITLLWDEYLGTPGERVEFIGRQENLMADLTLALKYAGLAVDIGWAADVRCNRSPSTPCEISSELQEKVLFLERGLVAEFYGGDEAPVLSWKLFP